MDLDYRSSLPPPFAEAAPSCSVKTLSAEETGSPLLAKGTCNMAVYVPKGQRVVTASQFGDIAYAVVDAITTNEFRRDPQSITLYMRHS